MIVRGLAQFLENQTLLKILVLALAKIQDKFDFAISRSRYCFDLSGKHDNRFL
jgi:hypothetical protein